ncbi:ion channel [Kineococcus sp. SYSU DK004]|uniref:ion channel n=1 Tax=Kineococcus sp. SYSU DK004 TaxID=3383125 RepID=UPI003D7CB7BF
MLGTLFDVLGALVVLVVCADALATTLHVGQAGPLTRHGLGLLWRGLLRLHRHDTSSRLLAAAGSVMLVLTVLGWVVGLWVGWTLVLFGSDRVVDSTTRESVPFADVVYYAGFSLFTLGVGDVVAAGSTGRLLSTLASFTGLFVITLSITYLLSVVSAVVASQALAVRITALGEDPAAVVRGGWTGQGFSSAFVQQLIALTDLVASSAETHLAYPVLHYFRGSEPSSSAVVALARLDDALLLLQHAVHQDARLEPGVVEPLRRTVERYLDTTSSARVGGDLPAPPAPDTEPLARAGVPLADAAEYAVGVAAAEQRRTSMRRHLDSNGWSWEPVGGGALG